MDILYPGRNFSRILHHKISVKCPCVDIYVPTFVPNLIQRTDTANNDNESASPSVDTAQHHTAD